MVVVVARVTKSNLQFQRMFIVSKIAYPFMKLGIKLKYLHDFTCENAY
jgi:hypothetical protein